MRTEGQTDLTKLIVAFFSQFCESAKNLQYRWVKIRINTILLEDEAIFA